MVGVDGLKTLQTVRLEVENIFTPEINTFKASTSDVLSDQLDRECDQVEVQNSQYIEEDCDIGFALTDK